MPPHLLRRSSPTTPPLLRDLNPTCPFRRRQTLATLRRRDRQPLRRSTCKKRPCQSFLHLLPQLQPRRKPRCPCRHPPGVETTTMTTHSSSLPRHQHQHHRSEGSNLHKNNNNQSKCRCHFTSVQSVSPVLILLNRGNSTKCNSDRECVFAERKAGEGEL